MLLPVAGHGTQVVSGMPRRVLQVCTPTHAMNAALRLVLGQPPAFGTCRTSPPYAAQAICTADGCNINCMEFHEMLVKPLPVVSSPRPAAYVCAPLCRRRCQHIHTRPPWVFVSKSLSSELISPLAAEPWLLRRAPRCAHSSTAATAARCSTCPGRTGLRCPWCTRTAGRQPSLWTLRASRTSSSW